MIKEFREIYNALDVLDRDYIDSIVANVKAIEKTSNDVRIQQGTLKQHSDKLASQQSKLDAHQVEIEKNVANISKIVTALKVFKEKLEGYKHLTDIDKIWNDCKSIKNEMRVVSDSMTKLSKKTTEDIATANNKNIALSDQVNRDIISLRNEAKSFKEFFSNLSEKVENTANLLENQISVIQDVSSFVKRLENISHMDDVDSMWDDINVIKENLDTINSSLQNIDTDVLNIQNRVGEIDSFISNLNAYTHLQDIDDMWDALEAIKTNIEQVNEDSKEQKNELGIVVAASTEHKESIDTLFKNMADTEEYALNSRNLINTLAQADEEFRECITSYANDINQLKESKNKLDAISHLDDVDNIWDDVEKHSSQLSESEKRDKELAETIQSNKDEVNRKIEEVVQTGNAAVDSLTKKVKYAYWIAGGSAGIAIIELILLLMKVI